jgi:LysR family nitrogen assimilation transcriptional regulator
MQLRHLRYFVKIVEAGSFSRAASTIHVAQPALSQQIAELELKLGTSLLQRSARGVRPTAAGEVLYREASTILRLVEQLPGIVRSSGGETDGAVSLGMSSTLAATLGGAFFETCKAALPRVTLKLAVIDSESIKARIEAHTLDLAMVFEDELVHVFSRKPLFRQRLYLVRRDPLPGKAVSISFDKLATLALILPSLPNVARSLLDRIVAEADVLSGIISAVNTGMGSTVLPKGDLSDIPGEQTALLIEPPLFLTASIISSGDFPLTYAGEAVQNVLIKFAESHFRANNAPGLEWIG